MLMTIRFSEKEKRLVKVASPLGEKKSPRGLTNKKFGAPCRAKPLILKDKLVSYETTFF